MDCEKVVLEMARMRRTIWNWNGFNQLKNVEEVKSVCTDSGMLSWKMWITVEKKKMVGKDRLWGMWKLFPKMSRV